MLSGGSAAETAGTPEAPAVRFTRMRGLDVLRAVAVLLVLGRHAETVTRARPGELGLLVTTWGRGGWIGVDLFFVLSGFLVTGLLFREHAHDGTVRPLRFLARRAFKIYPAFWVMLAATLVTRWALGLPIPPDGLLHELLFVQNYVPGLWNHTWTLAVEEHFYLFLALAVAWMARHGGSRPFAGVVPLAAFAMLVCLLGRVHLVRAGADWERVIAPTHLRIDALLFGAALSHLVHHAPNTSLQALARGRPQFTAVVGALLLSPPFLVDLAREATLMVTVGLTTITLGAGLLLLGVLRCEAPRRGPAGAALDALAWIGAHSYSIYLWHMLVGLLVHRWFARSWPERPLVAEAACYVLGALGVGIAAAKLVELPFLRLRERWVPSATGGGAVTPTPARS